MKTQRLLLFALTAAVLGSACKKDDEGNNSPASAPSTPTGNSLLTVFNDHVNSATQIFTVNASSNGHVHGQDGVDVYFGSNAFRTLSGGWVMGTVQIELVEVLTVGDMIWLNKQTLGNDNGQLRPLVSGGQYYLNATQNGAQLKLVDDACLVDVPAPDGTVPPMRLFRGTEDADGTIVWDPIANTVDIGQDLDTSMYTIPNDSLGWVNCDYYMNSGTQTEVQVTCPMGYTFENTIMWLVFPDQNSVTRLSHSEGNVFSTGDYYTLPLGMNVVVVAISNSGGVCTSSFTPTIVSAGMNPSITFSPTTVDEFHDEVDAL